jgi:hypothetical protein
VDDTTLAASEVDEGVAIGDAQEAESSGQRPPRRCRVVPSIRMVVLRPRDPALKVEAPFRDATRQLP